MKLLLALFCGAWLSCPALMAQSPQAPSSAEPVNDSRSLLAGCEYRTAVIERVREIEPADKPVTVVARLGDGEDRPNLNLRRLHNVRAYLTE